MLFEFENLNSSIRKQVSREIVSAINANEDVAGCMNSKKKTPHGRF